MATEYNQDQSTGLRSELDEPRRTTDQVKSDDFGTATQEQQNGGGYGGVSEEEPPHHKIHTDDEPLPKPAPGTYDEELPSSEPREEQVTPKPTGGEEEYGDAPKSTEGYQEYRDTEPTKFDESPVETQPRSYGTGAEKATNGSYADPSEAFPGAPVDRKVEEPGYGNDHKTSEPALDSSEPAMDSTSPTGAHKKEGLMTKIKEKLPGHHHKPADTVEPDTTMEHDTTGAPPKKGLMTKIKEKLPGHHSTTTGTTAE
jgi:hypothetical protein